MHLLPQNKYHLAHNTVASLPINHLFALSVIKGHVKGQIFTDSTDNPATYYVQHPYGMSLLFGDYTNRDFNDWIKAFALDKSKRSKQEWLQCYPDAWNGFINALIEDNMAVTGKLFQGIEKDVRLNFKFNKAKYPGKDKNSFKDDLQIVRCNENLFQQIKGTVVPRYFWNTAGEFNKTGLGFCLLENNKPAAVAFTAYVHKQQLEIGIETMAGFRGKGYAYAVACAFIEHCIQHGFEPVWACRKSNTPSLKLALKCGFEISREWPYYGLPYSDKQS